MLWHGDGGNGTAATIVHVAGAAKRGDIVAPDGTAQHIPRRNEHEGTRPVSEDQQHVVAAVWPQNVSGGRGWPQQVQSVEELRGRQTRTDGRQGTHA